MHVNCFFCTDSQRSLTPDDVENLEGLSYSDQISLLAKMCPDYYTIAKIMAKEKLLDVMNYEIAYSMTGDDCCFICQDKILYYEIRIKKIVLDSEVAAKYGKEILKMHFDCFVLHRNSHGQAYGFDMIPGFDTLQQNHQKIVKLMLP